MYPRKSTPAIRAFSRAIGASWGKVWIIAASLLGVVSAADPAHATVFPAEGGRGDHATELRCPAGHFLTGFKGRAGDWLDQISLICRQLAPPDYMSGPQTITAPLGGPGGSPVEASCEQGSAIYRIGFILRKEEFNDPRFVVGIAFSCHRPRDGSSSGDRVIGFGTTLAHFRDWTLVENFLGGTPEREGVIHACPGGEYATGLSIRYGQHVNAIGLICTNVTDPEADGFVERIYPGMEDNSDRPGSDYHRIELDGRKPKACQDACRADPQRCRAWTYVRPGVQVDKAVCYLKSAAPARASNICCVSGVEAGPAPQPSSKPVTGLGKKPSSGSKPNPDAANPDDISVSRGSGAATREIGSVTGSLSNADAETPAMMMGMFDTTFGRMVLGRDGGTYATNDGVITIGKIEGNVMRGHWQESKGRRCADGRIWGPFRFEFTETGFTGSYGYCEGEPNYGQWNGTRF